MSNFQQAFDYLFGDEGKKYTNKKNDKGGPTKFGITKATLERYLGRTCTEDEVANMREETAHEIYQALYWHPMKLDQVSSDGVATALFDTGVLYGIGTTGRMAQKALNQCGQSLDADGIMGEKSVAALNSVPPAQFMSAFKDQILERIERIVEEAPQDIEFRDGWRDRAARLLALVNKPQSGGIA